MTRPSQLVGRRIRSLREDRGLTQAQLADALGKTPTAVSYWEAGQRSPGLDELAAIARALRVELTDLLPREQPRVLARAQAADLAMAELVDVVDDMVERHEALEPLPPPPSPASHVPAEVAGIIRRAAAQEIPPIELGPVLDHCNTRYEELPLPDALSGLVVVVGGTPVIGVNRTHQRKRRRFSTAHELGHILLAHYDTFHVDLTANEMEPPNYNWRYERAANELAASLLVPAPLLRRDVEESTHPTVRSLAKRYDVSEQAMAIRLSTLGLRLWEPEPFASD